MTLYFDPTAITFLDDAIHTAIPANAIRITADKHAELMAAQGGGLIITADANGNPVATEPPALTTDEQMAQLRTERDRLLADCDFTQLSDSPLNQTQRTAWAAYRASLRNLPETYATNPAAVIWPEQPA